MRNKMWFVIIVMLCVAAFAGGIIYRTSKLSDENSEQTGKTSIEVYYIDRAESVLKAEVKEISGETKTDIINDVLEEMRAMPVSEELFVAIPENVKVNNFIVSDKKLTIDLSKEYKDMKAGEELLCRAAIVWTLTELDFIDGVKILIDGENLVRTNGEIIGVMKREDIVIDPSMLPEEDDIMTLKLYFALPDATGLVAEEREVGVSPNQPLEKYIVEELIAGPKEEGHIATVPSETKIRDISVVDGICYLDLSSEFVTKHAGGSAGEYLTIYSIVNSLAELDTISKVQFLIEGEKQNEYKGHMDFGLPFEPEEVSF